MEKLDELTQFLQSVEQAYRKEQPIMNALLARGDKLVPLLIGAFNAGQADGQLKDIPDGITMGFWLGYVLRGMLEREEITL